MKFTVITAEQYVQTLARLLLRAQKRVVLSAMVIMRGPQTDELLLPLIAAAKRGVAVHVLFDTFTYSLLTRPDYLDISEFRQACRETRQFFAELQAAGVRVSEIGKIGLNPYAGRYHAKVTVIDDDVFCFGGINLRDDSYDKIDYMLHTQDAALGTTLQNIVEQNAENGPAQDIELLISEGQTLLFDAGHKRQSIIYERACELARQAERVVYISQMAPSGQLAKDLAATKTTYFANRPNQTGLRPDSLGQWLDQRRSGMKNHYEGQSYLHAKVILYELPGGKTALISGSHNFSWRGVAFGTKEIALCSYDKQLWRKLHDIVYAAAAGA